MLEIVIMLHRNLLKKKDNFSKGILKGTIVICPRHASQFDMADGHVVRWINWRSTLAAIDRARSFKGSIITCQVTIGDYKIMDN